MRERPLRLPTLLRLTGPLLVSTSTYAADLAVRIVTPDGGSATQLAVLARPETGTTSAIEPGPPVRIVQQLQAFAPEVLPVAVGTTVAFPNLDRMRHHVYSFSPAKAFEIRLYSGDEVPEITFDKAGAVAIGCNIHDWMEGYVYVTEAPYFAGTDDAGLAKLELPPGNYRLGAWHPSFSTEIDAGTVSVAAGGNSIELSLPLPIKPFSQDRPDDDPLLHRFKHASE